MAQLMWQDHAVHLIREALNKLTPKLDNVPLNMAQPSRAGEPVIKLDRRRVEPAQLRVNLAQLRPYGTCTALKVFECQHGVDYTRKV